MQVPDIAIISIIGLIIIVFAIMSTEVHTKPIYGRHCCPYSDNSFALSVCSLIYLCICSEDSHCFSSFSTKSSIVVPLLFLANTPNAANSFKVAKRPFWGNLWTSRLPYSWLSVANELLCICRDAMVQVIPGQTKYIKQLEVFRRSPIGVYWRKYYYKLHFPWILIEVKAW